MRINHQVVVFDAADLTAESAFCAAVTATARPEGGLDIEVSFP